MTDEVDPGQADPPPRPADVASIPDGALRSALEFAVAIAANASKVRPAIPFPAALKPFTKSNRLDAAGLRAVRRALVADPAFRDRLALTGPDEMGKLVDPLGVAWLCRSDGWEDEVVRFHAAARAEAAEASAEAALRKAEKRREAAEQVAARAQAELIGLRESLARESSRRDDAEGAAGKARSAEQALRDEITGLRREVGRLTARLEGQAEAVCSAEAEVASTRASLAEVERLRDELLAERHAGPGSAARGGADVEADAVSNAGSNVGSTVRPAESPPVAATADQLGVRANAVAARALEQAAAATRDLAAALAAASSALGDASSFNPTSFNVTSFDATSFDATSFNGSASGVGSGPCEASLANRPPAGAVSRNGTWLDPVHAGVKPLGSRTDRRKPIATPGGLYGDSIAAAEHYLRAPKVCVIVDGYNVAKLAWPQLELIDQRECCIDVLEDMVRRLGTDIRVVFDGADVVGASSRRRLIRVQFSPVGVTADDVIRDEVRALPVTRPAVVVTNDQAIVGDVRAAGVNVISSDTLLALGGRSVPR